MRRSQAKTVDHFEDLLDSDIESLFAGGHVANTDLIPLRGFVEELRSLADAPLAPGFIEFHAAEAAEAAAQARVHAPPPAPGTRRNGARALRRRATAMAATLAMLLGATGMAWAADGAVPGDWNYGLDRALEAIGIGAGGAAERLEELQAIDPQPSAGSTVSEDVEKLDAPTDEIDKATGLERAIEAVTQERSAAAGSSEGRTRAADILRHLNDADRVDGSTVSDLASNGRSRPEDPGNSGQAGRPEDPGNSGQAGRPEDPGNSGQAGRPETPGNSAKDDSSQPGPKGDGAPGKP